MVLLVLIVIAVILLILDRWKLAKYVSLHQQLGNDWAYFPIIGNILILLGSNEDRMNLIIQITEQCYKRKFKAITLWAAHKLFFATADTDDATYILKSALDKNYLHKITKDFIGNGSLFAPVAIWRRKRKILVPSFTPRNVSKFVSVFEGNAQVVNELLEARVGKGNISCFDYLDKYALDSVCETVFGLNINVQKQPDHLIVIALNEGVKNLATRLCKPWLYFDAIYKNLPVFARQLSLLKVANNVIDDLICRKREMLEQRDHGEITSKRGDPTSSFKSFVELMIEYSKDNKNIFTTEELREESLVLAVAATETTAIGLSLTFLLLSQYADVQDKIYNEIQEVLGDSDKPLQEEELLKLKYLKAVIKETLRLYPPVPMILRHIRKDLQLPSGLILPEGCDVLINIWGIHHNSEHWGDDADKFNPDRFLSGKTSSPNAFLAFSHGLRNCIGQHYAILSMTTILVTLLRRYRFVPATNFKYDENNPLRMAHDLVLKHVDNFPVQIEYRDKSL